MLYSTYIPDSCVIGDEVSIVCNEFTQIETDRAESDEQVQSEYNPQYGKTWTSNIRLPSLMDYWENKSENISLPAKKAFLNLTILSRVVMKTIFIRKLRQFQHPIC